jgi:hypothetical protein
VFACGLSPFEAGFYCSLQNEVTGGGDGGHSMKFAEKQRITTAEVCEKSSFNVFLMSVRRTS